MNYQAWANEPWFHELSRDGAQNCLEQRVEGGFIVRPTSDRRALAVTVKSADGVIMHSLIESDDSGLLHFSESAERFASIGALLLSIESRFGVPMRRRDTLNNSAQLGPLLTFELTTVSGQSMDSVRALATDLKRTNAGIRLLPPELARLQSLMHVDFSHNSLLEVPLPLTELPHLRTLVLANNSIQAIPPEIGRLTALRSLSLRSNPLTAIDRNIAFLGSLDTLTLANARLASLPSAIGRLSSLVALRLASNSLVQLPKQLGNLSRLGELDVSCNRLVELPRELCALTSLTMLYAHSNALATFPRELCRCTNLVHLYLANNQLTDLPRKVGRLKALEKLLLGDNRLTSLPSSLLKLQLLMRIELHGNPQLDPTIPVDANCVVRLPDLLDRLRRQEEQVSAQRLMYVSLPPEQPDSQRAPLVYLNLPPEPELVANYHSDDDNNNNNNNRFSTIAAKTMQFQQIPSDPRAASTSMLAASRSSGGGGGASLPEFARQIDYSQLDFGREPTPTLLGKGATARVLAATFGGIDVAVKLLHCEESESDSAMEALLAELRIASLFSHPHIVQVLACAVEPPNFAIVMERMQSSLYYDLHVQKRQFSARERLHVARGVAAAVAFVHAQHAMHRDIKSANVLLGEGGAVKLSDFGTARLMTTLSASSLTSNVGTAQWTAPEVLTGSDYNSCADVYSFGILLWELYAQQVPYAALQLPPVQLGMQVAMKQLRPTLPVPNAPAEMMDLARQCWAAEPATRPPMAQVVQRLRSALEQANRSTNNNNSNDNNDDDNDDNNDDDDKLCVVCMATKREAAMQCGHVALCVECGQQLDKCPMCNAPKQVLIKLYGI